MGEGRDWFGVGGIGNWDADKWVFAVWIFLIMGKERTSYCGLTAGWVPIFLILGLLWKEQRGIAKG